MANKTTQDQRIARLRAQSLAYRTEKIREILASEGICATQGEAEELLHPISLESEKWGWLDLGEFKSYEIADMLDKLHFVKVG